MRQAIRRHTSLCLAAAALFAFAAPSVALAMTDAEIRGLFAEGEDLFRKANDLAAHDPEGAKDLYGKAVLRFERIVEEGGIHNGGLFYNIGNAYFRMGDLGRAILNYRMAQRYAPNDPNVQQNLLYARSRRADRIEERQQTKVLKTVLFWHYDLSGQTRSVLFLLCYLGFWIGAIGKRIRGGWIPPWLLVGLGVLASVFFTSLCAEAWASAHEAGGVVLSQEVTARKGDSESYEPSFKEPLHAGAEFEAIENRGNWIHVELPDGRRCWLPTKDVGLCR